MKVNQWTLGLAAAGVVSLGSVVSAEEAPSQVLTQLSSTTLSGYVDTSVMWKPGTGNGFMPGRAFDGGMGNLGGNKLDGFNLNVVKLQLEKPLDEGTWSAGYKVGLLFGPDANAYNTSASGFGFGGGSADFSVKDAYVALRAPVGNGLDFKLGTWATPIGYEVFESGDNPNYSRSYGWQLEPTQHTGILASYHVSDMLTLSGGVANTWSAGINARSPRAETHKAFIGTATITVPEDRMGVLGGSSLYLGVVDGFAAGATKDVTSYYAGHTMRTPWDGFNIGLAFDYREDGPSMTGTDSWAWAAAFYASFQATEKLKLNGRVDYTRGTDGTFYDDGGNGVSDHSNELLGLTLTTDYTLWDNVLTRLEARWDHAYHGRPYSGSSPGSFLPPSHKNAITLALNLVYKF